MLPVARGGREVPSVCKKSIVRCATRSRIALPLQFHPCRLSMKPIQHLKMKLSGAATTIVRYGWRGSAAVAREPSQRPLISLFRMLHRERLKFRAHSSRSQQELIEHSARTGVGVRWRFRVRHPRCRDQAQRHGAVFRGKCDFRAEQSDQHGGGASRITKR